MSQGQRAGQSNLSQVQGTLGWGEGGQVLLYQVDCFCQSLEIAVYSFSIIMIWFYLVGR